MAKLINEKSKLKLEYDYGPDDNGKTNIKSKTYSNLNTDLEAEDIVKVSDMISKLSSKELVKTKVIVEKEVTEEE